MLVKARNKKLKVPINKEIKMKSPFIYITLLVTFNAVYMHPKKVIFTHIFDPHGILMPDSRYELRSLLTPPIPNIPFKYLKRKYTLECKNLKFHKTKALKSLDNEQNLHVNKVDKSIDNGDTDIKDIKTDNTCEYKNRPITDNDKDTNTNDLTVTNKDASKIHGKIEISLLNKSIDKTEKHCPEKKESVETNNTTTDKKFNTLKDNLEKVDESDHENTDKDKDNTEIATVMNSKKNIWKISEKIKQEKRKKKADMKKDKIPKPWKKIIKKRKRKDEPTKEKQENNYNKKESDNNNKEVHTKNGKRKNTGHYKILQLNASNSCFNSKILQLRNTIDTHMSQIIVLSEANVHVKDEDKIEERRREYSEFNFEDKLVKDHKLRGYQ